jgi:glutathione S-transferase
LTLYHRSTSPDSMQVRIALNYKNIPFEKVLVDSQDRSGLDRVSGQPHAPALTHNGSVVFDSGAILRYLETHFCETPPLFSSDRVTLNEIERWESLGRGDLKRCVATLLRNSFSASPDMEELDSASEQFYEITGKFEERLGRSKWLVEDRVTAADVTTGPTVCYGMLLPSIGTLRSLGESITERFKLGVERARTEEWMMRVMAYDR